MVDLKDWGLGFRIHGFDVASADEPRTNFAKELLLDFISSVDDCREADSAGHATRVAEHELDLLVDEFELPLATDAILTSIDDLVEESNRYFKRQYEEACSKEQTHSSGHSPSPIGRSPKSLFELSAAVVAAHMPPKLYINNPGCLPEDIIEAVQRRMPKQRQAACFGRYCRWEPSPVGNASNEEEDKRDVVRRERQTWTLVKSCPYDALGRKHGEAREWGHDGILFSSTQFQFGERSGVHVEYFADGQKSLEAHYRDGHLHGELKWWYPLVDEQPIIADNKRSPQLARTQSYVNGFKEGAGYIWRDDGSLWRIRHYHSDCKHGVWRTFDQSGNVVKCVRYDHGRKLKGGVDC